MPDHLYRWIVEIEGRPAVRNVLDPLPSLTSYEPAIDTAYVGTMATVLNAIPDVCAAKPGILHAPIFAPWRHLAASKETSNA